MQNSSTLIVITVDQMLRLTRTVTINLAASITWLSPFLSRFVYSTPPNLRIFVQHGHNLDTAHQTLRHQAPHPPCRSLVGRADRLQEGTSQLDLSLLLLLLTPVVLASLAASGSQVGLAACWCWVLNSRTLTHFLSPDSHPEGAPQR